MTTRTVSHQAVDVIGPTGPGRVVFVCEHASCRIPEGFDGLGLSDAALRSHVAWDPGALALAQNLAARFEAPLVAGGLSRLLYDCNRPPEAPDAIPERSEIYDIPGNHGLSPAQHQARIDQIYRPFETRLAEVLDQVRPNAMVTIHSFTPIYNGQPREVEIGVLHDVDTRLADVMLTHLDGIGHICRRNEPYAASDGVTHTLRHHAQPRGLANVMLEIRNDLIADEAGVAHMGDVLGRALDLSLPDIEKG